MRPAPVLTLVSLVVGATAAVGLGAGPASSATPSAACKKSLVTELALAKDEEGTSAALSNFGSIGISCRDLNGDGRKDAQFLVNSGGTGGAFSGGIVADDGNGPVLRAWVTGHSKTSSGFRKGLPAFAWPVYRKGDANCCASGGWKVRRFRPRGDAFDALKVQTLKSQTFPLKTKP